MKCRCPYCGAEMEHKIEFEALSPRRKQLLEIIVAAGPNGIEREEAKRIFFPNGDRTDTTLRTTIFNINRVINPRRILCSGGTIRMKIK